MTNKFVEITDHKVKRIFTVEDLGNLFRAGILSNNESVELIEGEILQRRETIAGELQKAETIAQILEREFDDKVVIKI